jgi:hypothetical protein
MACGSQKWNGNCADLVKQPPRISSRAGRYSGEADQQEGRQARQLPEDQQQQDIIRQDDAQHRPLEQQQVGEKPPHRVGLRQIEPGIDNDQQPDAKDHAGEHQAKRIQEEVEVEPEQRDPLDADLNGFPGHHRRRQDSEDHQGRERDSCGSQGARVSPRPDGQGGSEGSDQGQEGEHEQQGSGLNRRQ